MTPLDALAGQLAPLAPHLAPTLAWLARTSLDAAAIAMLVLLAQSALGRWLTPAWRYRLWGLVVLRLVLPVLPASPTSVWNLHVAAPIQHLFTAPAEARSTPPPTQQSPVVPAPRSGLTVKVFVEPLDPAAAAPAMPDILPPPSLPPAAPPPIHPGTPSRLPLLFALAWLTGVVLLLSRLVISNLAFARRLRGARPADDPALMAMLSDCGRLMGVSRVPPVLVTDAVRGPAAAGVWRRRILLPPGLFETLSPAERRAVLLHELAHVRCRDVAANWLLAVLQAVHWFNPVLWLAFARLRADRELARDAMVLSVAATVADDDTDASATAAQRYAQTLLRLTERLSARPAGLPANAAAVAGVAGIVSEAPWSSPLVPALFGGRTALQRRLRMISHLPASAGRFTFVGPALLLALGCGTLTRPTSGEPAASAAAPRKPATQPQLPGEERRVEGSAQRTDPGEQKIPYDEILRHPADWPDVSAVGDASATAGRGADREERRVEKGELHAKVQELVSKDQVREALALVEETLRSDPHNEYALGVRPMLQDKVALDAQRAGQRKQEPREDAEAFLAKLDRKLPEVRFDEVALADVINSLRETGGVNIFVNWKAIETAGIERTAPVTTRLYNVKFSKALQVILDTASNQAAHIGYTIDEGVITVSTADDLAKNTLTRVYDIRDLLVAAPDFEPGEGLLGLGATTRPSEPRPNQQEQQDEARKGREGRAKDVVKLITETIATDTWRENGGSIGSVKELSGQLVVTQTPENHLQLTMLLEQLRETRSIQATVEARFVSCDARAMDELLARWMNAAAGAAGAGPATKPIVAADPKDPAAAHPTIAVFLDERQVAELLRLAQGEGPSTIVTAPRLTLFNGQRAYVLASTQQAYVRDYKAVKGDAAAEFRYEPVYATAESGVLMDVSATASADRRFITLALHPKLSRLTGMKESPWSGRPAGSNLTVKEPQMDVSELRTLVSVPDGGTVLLGGLQDAGGILTGAAASATQPAVAGGPATTQPARRPRGLYMLVKSKLIIQRETEQKKFPLVSPPTSRPAR